MNPLQLPPSADHAETPDPIEEPVALANAQLDHVAAGLTAAASINLADLQPVASAAVHVATALQGPCCVTTGMINPDFRTIGRIGLS